MLNQEEAIILTCLKEDYDYDLVRDRKLENVIKS